MIAFHGDQNIKDRYVARVKAHAIADEIQHGFYLENGKGCAVGCTIHGADHSRYEDELGVPKILALLEDRIFEGMDNGDAKEFPLRFLSAIEPGAVLSGVWYQFAQWLLVDPTEGVLQYAKTDRMRASIQAVAELYARVARGEAVKKREWVSARKKAGDAAAYAAAYVVAACGVCGAPATDAYVVAAAVGAAADAYAAAYAVAACGNSGGVGGAAVAYAYADARRIARQRAFKRQADKLIELMAAAPAVARAEQRRLEDKG